MGIPPETARHWIKKVNAFNNIDPAIRDSMGAVGTNMVPALVWAKTKDPDGTSYSTLLKPAAVEESPEDILERLKVRLEAIRPAPSIARPKSTDDKLLNFLPLFDVHLSMRVGDYGTAQAVERLREGSSDILDRLPRASHVVIVNGGDFTHQNDPSNLTPQSKHPLPVDMEYDDTTDIATDVTVEIIEKALRVSDRVIYQPLRGNHDPNTARILRAALRQRYRRCERVEILTDNTDFFARRWKNNLLCAHHGDIRGKQAKDLVLGFASRYAEAWGKSKYRELWVGHLHHIKSQEFPGMLVNQCRAICPKDRHSIEGLWESESEMVGVTYHENGGRYSGANHYFG